MLRFPLLPLQFWSHVRFASLVTSIITRFKVEIEQHRLHLWLQFFHSTWLWSPSRSCQDWISPRRPLYSWDDSEPELPPLAVCFVRYLRFQTYTHCCWFEHYCRFLSWHCSFALAHLQKRLPGDEEVFSFRETRSMSRICIARVYLFHIEKAKLHVPWSS